MPADSVTTDRVAVTRVTQVDTHAHVFTRRLALAEERRYAPEYDAAVADYLAMLDRNGTSHGVLVQPSFLGTDNAYLVEALRTAPERLRGIAVVAPEAEREELEALGREGVAGVRLNLIGQADPAFEFPVWQRHLGHLAALGWQVELQAEARRLPVLLSNLLEAGIPVVVDHFGRRDGVDDPGFRFLLDAAATRRVWVKLSGGYRVGPAIAAEAAPLLLASFGPERLLWGSDWPHTQFERQADPADARADLDRWVPDPAARRVVLADAPARLFGFNGQSQKPGGNHE